MIAIKETIAAGFIIFRFLSNDIQYLLLQTSYESHHWTPPKGHVDEGESEFAAAERETKEEAGLSVKEHLKKIDGFEKVLRYNVRGKPKKVIYWLSQVVDPNAPIVLSDEHQSYEWLGLSEAVARVVYPDMQETLKEADGFIKTLKSKQ